MADADHGADRWTRPAPQGFSAPDGAPVVPGVLLHRLLGVGAAGEVWLARDLVSGDLVAVKVRLGPAGRSARGAGGEAEEDGDPDAAERLAREIALLRRVDHPHVVRLRRVVDLPAGGRALVMDHAGGGSLAALVDRRGPRDPLTASEACGVVVPVAGALADLHARGLVHGDVTAANVLFTADARPLLADLGCATVLVGEGSATAADDVAGLGALLRGALRSGDVGRVPDPAGEALLGLADRCLDPDPVRRPTAATVAAEAGAAAAPGPVRLTATQASPPSAPPSAPVTSRVLPGPPLVTPSGRPVVVRLPGDPPTVSTAVPLTHDLHLAPGADGGATGPAARVEAPTRRRTARTTATPAPLAVRPDPAITRRADRRGGRVGGRRTRLTGPVTVIGLAAAVVAVVWFVLGGAAPPAAIDPAPPAARSPDRSSDARAAPATTNSSGPSRGPGPVGEPVGEALARLAAARARVFADPLSARLDGVDEPGSPAQAADQALLSRLRDRGVRLAGLSFSVRVVGQSALAGGAVAVTADVTTSQHRQVPISGGATDRVVPPSGPRRVVVVLVPSAQGWLVRSAEAA